MTVARTFRALEFYDILANLVPGAVLLLTLSAIFQIEKYIRFSTGTIAAGVFLVTALVFGHIIQAIASELDGKNTLFGEVIQATREDTEKEPTIEVNHVVESVWPLMKRKFALPDDFNDYGELFRLVLSYIETTPATRALRFQALHSFHRSMWAVGYITSILTLVGALLKCIGWIGVRPWPILGLILLGSIGGTLVFGKRKKKMNQLFIQYTLVDFYSDQIERVGNTTGEKGS